MRKARETRSSKYEGKTDLDGGGNARGEGYCDSRRLFRESESRWFAKRSNLKSNDIRTICSELLINLIYDKL